MRKKFCPNNMLGKSCMGAGKNFVPKFFGGLVFLHFSDTYIFMHKPTSRAFARPAPNPHSLNLPQLRTHGLPSLEVARLPF